MKPFILSLVVKAVPENLSPFVDKLDIVTSTVFLWSEELKRSALNHAFPAVIVPVMGYPEHLTPFAATMNNDLCNLVLCSPFSAHATYYYRRMIRHTFAPVCSSRSDVLASKTQSPIGAK